jgi:hypothetical protein
MGSTAYAAYNNGSAGAGNAHTVTAMGRWSVLDKQLPAVDKIKAIHVYDFDNTREELPPALCGLFLPSLIIRALSASQFSRRRYQIRNYGTARR